MIGDEQVARRVTRMSYAQRAALWRALEFDRARHGWAHHAPGRAAEAATQARSATLHCATSIADELSITDMFPLFESREWRDVWRPGASFHVYAVGCTGLGRIASAVGPLAKVGTAECGGLDRRLGELRRREYGSVVRTAAKWVAEPGWADWALVRKMQVAPCPPACPIRAADQTLIMTVPSEWAPGEAEALVNATLAPYRVQRYAVSDAGQALCLEHAFEPGALIRYSRKARSFEAATELTRVRAQADAPRIAGMLASAMAKRLRARAGNPVAPAWRILDHAGPAVALNVRTVGVASTAISRTRLRRPAVKARREVRPGQIGNLPS